MSEKTLNEREEKIKIYVSCHKDAYIPQNELLYPIQVGTALAENRLPGMLYDNIGDNISARNKQYCELTAQYWAWKNEDADYYGFFHYRRYFSFYGETLGSHIDEIEVPFLDDEVVDKIMLKADNMRNLIQNYDIIIPFPLKNGQTVKEQFIENHGALFFETLCSAITEYSPQYVSAMQKYFSCKEALYGNMFIMKKAIFNDYCKWLFGLLSYLNEKIDYEYLSQDENRFLAYAAERLLGVYIEYLQDKKYNTLYLQKVFIKYTDPDKKIEPAFDINNIPIALCCDNNYMFYTTVLIESLIEHASEKFNYDILVFNTDITPVNSNRIIYDFKSHTNVKIRFVNLTRKVKKTDFKIRENYFGMKEETFYRLVLPEVLECYDKILYLDCDLIVNHDIRELFDIDVSNYYLAAALDADVISCYYRNEKNRRFYVENVLKIHDPNNYFQAGVMVLNLCRFREEFTAKYLISLAKKNEYTFVDQDLLNSVCDGKVLILPMEWNYPFDVDGRRQRIEEGPKEILEAYLKAKNTAKIVHFAGWSKPWDCPGVEFSDLFWSYAENTSVYEKLIQRLPYNKYIDLQMLKLKENCHVKDAVVIDGAVTEKNEVSSVNVILSANNNYVPFLAVIIQSIAENSSFDNNYNIYILQQDIQNKHMRTITQMVCNYTNISVKFVNINSFISRLDLPVRNEQASIETFFRMFAHEILLSYDKCLYLDCDMVVESDIAELYKTDISDYYIAACRDIDCIGCYAGYVQDRKQYLEEVLGLTNPYDYFQAGVCLLNLKKLRENFSLNFMINKIFEKEWRFDDQDILNSICQNHTYFLDTAWNYVHDYREEFRRSKKIIWHGPMEIYTDYLNKHDKAKIIHYSGTVKPWQNTYEDLSEHFWKYARKTPYYDLIVQNIFNNKFKENKCTLKDSQLFYQVDDNGVKIKGVEDIVYVDGLLLKVINQFNKRYPIDSKKRNRLKRIIKFFMKN